MKMYCKVTMTREDGIMRTDLKWKGLSFCWEVPGDKRQKGNMADSKMCFA